MRPRRATTWSAYCKYCRRDMQMEEMGEVVKKEVTASGRRAIVVFFQRLGERRLVENQSG